MIRLLGGGLVAFLVLALWIYCTFDAIASEAPLIRNLPKPAWVLLVIFLPVIGSIAWLLLGRPSYAGWRPGDTTYRPIRPVVGPEDHPSFSASGPSLPDPAVTAENDRLQAWEDDLRRREEDLRRRERDEGDD